MALTQDMIYTLIKEAKKAMAQAYAPYSGFYVGAALLTKGGLIYTGCNIENAALTPGNCAERTAFFRAVADGIREFKAIAIIGGKDGRPAGLCPPCGVCRQVMLEFCDPETFMVIMAASDTQYEVHSLAELVPFSFGPAAL